MTLFDGSPQVLARRYDVALLDLDGVVYVGPEAVPAAAGALAAARATGMRLAFVTNNAARPAADVAAHLTRLGIAAQTAEVVTSAQTAAHYLSRRLAPGAKVLVVGTHGLIQALEERGLSPVFSADDDPEAVVQGYSPELNWAQLAEGAVAIRRGVEWVATNLDSTVPSARGPVPGNGSMVAALRHATGAEPVSTGKPDPTMHAETVDRSGAQRPLVVGDRLDTDIEGARRVGCDSLLVFSGVTTPVELLRAPAHRRPDYLADDLGGIMQAHPAVVLATDETRCGPWSVTVGTDGLLLAADGPTGLGDERADHLDALRALCALAWTVDDQAEPARHPERAESSVDSDPAGPAVRPESSPRPPLVIRAADDRAARALADLGLVP